MNRIQFSPYVGLGLIILFALLGAFFGTPEPSGSTFGDTIRAFASDDKTRMIIAAILIDVVLGISAAMRIGTFDAQAVAKFHSSNVLPYVLAYLMLWSLQVFGLGSALPSTMSDAIASVSFGTIVTTLTGSIFNNVNRLRTPIVPTSDNGMVHTTLTDGHG